MKTRSELRKQNSLAKPSEHSEDNTSTKISPDSDIHEFNSDKKRFRKNEEQVKVLLNEFNKKSYWTKELVSELSKKTGLSESQVYKWNWDYRKRLRKSVDPISQEFRCKETILPSKLESDLLNLQKFYKLSLNFAPIATPSRFLFTNL